MTFEPPIAPSRVRASGDYLGLADLPPLLTFASASLAARGPLLTCWHPGDIIWELRERADQAHPAHFWRGADGVEMLAWMVGPGEAWIEALPSAEARIADAVRWAEDAWRAARGDNQRALSVRAYALDHVRVRTLEALGYARSGPEGICFRLSLEEVLPSQPPPEAFTTLDCIDVDPVLRAAAHRAAWSHLEHLGIHAQSQFSAEAYASLLTLSVYDPSLDILVAAPSGEYAANCIAWADAASGVGVFEPVGTALAYRGQRLARLAMHEALRRMQARGLREARVGTAHFNASAISAYLHCGFQIADTSHWWSKTLD